ncbi:DUF2537 domain-containing protein [Actinocrispum sp. NPDC049592]|uniref:DUF2537 domain-containing protein n=1 Tax=Actinocrispum sp. NPDC049592 TaxID=3154835 RepID=UPI00343227B7
MELHTNGERVVLTGPDATEVEPGTIPGELSTALDEWAQVVAAMQRADAPEDPTAAVVVSRRGRQLADRVSAALGTTVRYHDPLTGEVLVVDATVTRPAPEPRPPELTPWLTGLTVSGMVGLITLAAVVTLALTLNETSALLAVGANVVVTAGLAPSVWLARKVLVWRWVALGVAAGLALGWVALIVVLI